MGGVTVSAWLESAAGIIKRVLRQRARMALLLATLTPLSVPANDIHTLGGTQSLTFSLDGEPLSALPQQLPIDAAKQALGQALFFDRRLSASGEQSCGDCHQLPAIGPAEQQLPVFRSELGGKHQRDIPLLYNLSSYFWLNWDGRYTKLERLIEDSITAVDKFNSSWPEVLSKLGTRYQQPAKQLYGSELTQAVVVDALALFLRGLNTPDAPLDHFLRGDTQALSARQLEGYQLFKRIGCVSCHNGRALGANFFIEVFIYRHDDGKESEPRLKDLGRYYVTGEEADRNSFRVPSLRNVAMTAPYFHDGSVPTLEDAVEEMAEHQLGIVPSEAQIALLVEFLQSLTGIHPGIEPSGDQP